MCGRYTLRRVSLVSNGFDADPEPAIEESSEYPLFNIAPSQKAPVIRINAKGRRAVGYVRWGLIPSWTRGKPKTQPINARSESAVTSPMFRQAMERRRCLVPADGFYEWKGAKPPKQPYFIHRKDEGLFAMAGIWERWKPENSSEPIDTFAILTTEPNELMRSIHNRMPVILAEKDFDQWLDRNTPIEKVKELLAPCPSDPLLATPVQSTVNSPRNTGPECIEPINGHD